jgi:WD40 repeat protein
VKGKWVFHTSRVTALAWSPSGSHLASGSLDENIFVWSLSNPANKLQLAYAHTGGVTSLAWAEEKQLISGGNDHTIVSWRIPEV